MKTKRLRWFGTALAAGTLLAFAGALQAQQTYTNPLRTDDGEPLRDHPMGPWVKAVENPIMTTDLSRGVSSPGHNSIAYSPDGTERFILYHRHTDPRVRKPSFDRAVCIDRLAIGPDGRLRVEGPTSTPQPMPSGAAMGR